jgi:hypothetical protein
MNEVLITKDILENAGFEYMEQESKLCEEYQKTTYGITDYKLYRKCTDDKHPIKLDIDNGWNNRGTKWSLHIDNDACETIGCADIDYTWQFNKLMEVFDSSLRLPEESILIPEKTSTEILDDLFQELDDKKNKLIEKCQIHSISLYEREKERNELDVLINKIHHQFIKCCTEAADEVYHKYEFSYASPCNLSLLDVETTEKIDMLFHQYELKLNPMLIYDILYKNNDDAYKESIRDADKYAILNKYTLQVEFNPHYIEKHILELFGFKL